MIIEVFEKPSNNLLHIDSNYIYEIKEIKGGSRITLKVKDEYFVYEVYDRKFN